MSTFSRLLSLAAGGLVLASGTAGAITLQDLQTVLDTTKTDISFNGRSVRQTALSNIDIGLSWDGGATKVWYTPSTTTADIDAFFQKLANQSVITLVSKDGKQIPTVTLNTDLSVAVFNRAANGTGGGTEIFDLTLGAGLTFNADPQINFPFSVQNRMGSTQNYSFSFTLNLTPSITQANLVKSNLTGTLRDGFGTTASQNGTEGIGLISPTIVQTSVLDGGSPVSLGVNVGNAQSFVGALGNTSTYVGQYSPGPGAGPYSNGPTPVTGFTQMTQTVSFSLTPGDRASMVAFSEIVPVPEPTTYMLMVAGLAVLGTVARRRGAV
jgi:hypothetical protein